MFLRAWREHRWKAPGSLMAQPQKMQALSLHFAHCGLRRGGLVTSMVGLMALEASASGQLSVLTQGAAHRQSSQTSASTENVLGLRPFAPALVSRGFLELGVPEGPGSLLDWQGWRGWTVLSEGN